MTTPTDSIDISFLSAATVFSPLPLDVLRKLFERGQLRRYESGSLVFRPNEPTEEMYVVKSGVVEICRADPETRDVKVVAYLGEGDSVGEMVLFTGSPRSSFARVPQEAEIFALSRAGMIELCREEPDLALYFCRLFASRLESWVKKGRRQDVQRQLQGNLRYFDLATILQTLGSTERTGTLTIALDTGQTYAELEFHEGRMKYARLAHLRGEQAFFQLFQPPPEGNFQFRGGVHLTGDVGAPVDLDVLGLLMDAMRLQDEWNVVKGKFEDQDRILLPATSDLAWDDDETLVAASDVWYHLSNAAPLSQLLHTVPYSTAVIFMVLDRLLESSQVR